MNKIIVEFPDEFEIKLKKNKEKVLVVGEVQSGKTKFIISTIESALDNGYDCAVVIGGTNNNLLLQTNKRINDSFGIENVNIINIEQTILKELPKGKSLVTALKYKDSLLKLLQLLKNSENKKIIIFDDESDFGSINVNMDGDRSSLSKILFNIYNEIYSGLFISITATPFAEILSSDSIFIDRSFVIDVNSEYTGSSFFLENELYDVSESIEKYENGISSIAYANYIYDHIDRIIKTKKEGIGTQLLINNNLKVDKHEEISEKVSIVLEQLYFIEKDPIKKTILNELKENLIVLNRNNDIKYNKTKHSIIIGGSLVSRGYSFDKLLTTIMFNEPKGKLSADTLLQRARWFGYRKEYFENVKVHVGKRTFEALKEADKLIKDIYKSLNEKSIINVKDEILEMKFQYIKPTGKKNNEKRVNKK